MSSPRAAVTLVLADAHNERAVRVAGAAHIASSDVAGVTVCVAEVGSRAASFGHKKNTLFVAIDAAEAVGCDVLVVDTRTKGPPTRAAAAAIGALNARLSDKTAIYHTHRSHNENTLHKTFEAAEAAGIPSIGLLLGPSVDTSGVGAALVDVVADALHVGGERRMWAWQNPLADPPVRYAPPRKNVSNAPWMQVNVEFLALAILSAVAWMTLGVGSLVN
jgi:hypothetical protein